jgi:hypothetical protein
MRFRIGISAIERCPLRRLVSFRSIVLAALAVWNVFRRRGGLSPTHGERRLQTSYADRWIA